MRLPLQISFRNMHHSEAVERAVVERAERLERFSDQIDDFPHGRALSSAG